MPTHPLRSFPTIAAFFFVYTSAVVLASEPVDPTFQHWLWAKAYHIPSQFTSEESGYFSIVEGKDGEIYLGTAKYGDNAYLVEYNPATKAIKMVVDAEKEIGIDRKGFAAQAKIHTRNHVGESGRVYFGTKQGYAKEGEKNTDYLGGHPMVFDPRSGTTRVYDIPVPHQGIISITPDESRGIAYLSTCSDERPVESTHFMILDLKSGKYRDLLDCRHMYAFIVVDYLGRAYHPILGGEIARYDPRTDSLERLKQTIDGKPPTPESLLADPQSHPINWELSPDKKTLYAVAMSGNQLYAYDLTSEGNSLRGRSLGALCPHAASTDCRALCVGADGTVFAGVAATRPNLGQFLHIVSYQPGQSHPTDLGPIAVGNPDYVAPYEENGNAKPYHHGIYHLADGTLLPRYVIMGIAAARDGTVYVTTLCPFTLHAIKIPKAAGITTVYRQNSHADLLLTRLLKTDTLDGQGMTPAMRLVSLYTDQVPEIDLSRPFGKEFQFQIFDTISATLRMGTDKLAVDGVLLIAEHGNYPETDTGQFAFPKRRMFGEVVDTFRQTGRVVPVFNDKHLADNWNDAKWIYDTAREMKIPLMAGSSLPVLWREPPVDVPRGAKLKEIAVVSYHRLDSYGFHALEIAQALAERRLGGETGIQSVQCIVGDAVWDGRATGVYDDALLHEALDRLRLQPIPAGKTIRELVPHPVLFAINYRDGLKTNIFTLNGAVAEWTAAWKDAVTGTSTSTLFAAQEDRPFAHFTYQLMGIEKMMHTGVPTWPVERTLLTSGALDALLISKRDGGMTLETPQLHITYLSNWNWRQPPPAPPGRPLNE